MMLLRKALSRALFISSIALLTLACGVSAQERPAARPAATARSAAAQAMSSNEIAFPPPAAGVSRMPSAAQPANASSGETAGKKKMSKKTMIYIFDTIVSGLMHILVGTLAFMIVLIVLKWFFLERRVDKD